MEFQPITLKFEPVAEKIRVPALLLFAMRALKECRVITECVMPMPDVYGEGHFMFCCCLFHLGAFHMPRL